LRDHADGRRQPRSARTGIPKLPDNLSVGGRLDLRSTGIIDLSDNLTVGGSLDLCGTRIADTH
jgi:hypothetical protein